MPTFTDAAVAAGLGAHDHPGSQATPADWLAATTLMLCEVTDADLR
ncbi:hypothetical protein SK803_43305 [Lentzea sp. BCCO 10_0856]|uniref:Uncharacterized protein n=1 Tax=Lentzea miocenica TaxID=3095431 RepID=A0ABU4TFY7_9PSEU|nr:hypothetical protein [Lentzea sp. BCCO 10_0856]MDX8037061.1 hypothetical protein [Lentzea sp. BCCO 10_0856]